MRILIALGGNALLRRGEDPDIETQRRNVEVATEAIAGAAREHTLVITHGNGPQVGYLAMQSEAAGADTPLDVLGAESEGLIGYLLEQSLRNRLTGREVATLLTQVVVDPNDPAFVNPTKPVGPVYSKAQAAQLARTRGWTMVRDGEVFRRAVPSPRPLGIVELRAIELLVEAGVTVICVGGGGIPVVIDDVGRIRGTEAVIDKDRTAGLLAHLLAAEMFVMLTDVAAVEDRWGTPDAQPIRRTSSSELGALHFEPGSMGPKVEAARTFVEATGRPAAIGAMEDLDAIVRGTAGTIVAPG